MTFPERTIYLLHRQCSADISIDFALLRQHIKGKFYLICSNCFRSHLRRQRKDIYFDAILSVPSMDDFSAITEAIEANVDIQHEQFDILSIEEPTVSLCGKLKRHYGLQDFDHESYVDKLEMKARLRNSGIVIPQHQALCRQTWLNAPASYLDQLVATIPFPCFIKPIDQAGAVRAARLDNQDALEHWLANWQDDGYQYEIDEFIDGTLYHCESILRHGEIIYSQVNEYSTPCFNITLGQALGSITLAETDPDHINISIMSRKVHALLAPIKHGVTHLEVFKKHDGTLVFLEIAYRPPGNLASEMYLQRCGIPLKELHIFIQVDPEMDLAFTPTNYVARYIYPLPPMEGVVNRINPPQLTSDFQTYWNYHVGDAVNANTGLCKNAGRMLLWNDDETALRADFEKLRSYYPYTVTPSYEVISDAQL
ncbi:ATP-grasp domain-containing protein [Photobacterium lutimaris]|uniref:ATP-grasp domain-containing protein n=1 Tax=Photobacterium lutimaris TaxID=388278 RepID=A0A2T3J339_9GAMM|nr:hypothetical protein [Photobacterium lutimaris]PSU35709.1 hypothetical protein C9I99_01440 [Photobacterium lutimaris]TDR78771.1 hypothetical protein DFP78_101284 [Photobacterium lutimaris]